MSSAVAAGRVLGLPMQRVAKCMALMVSAAGNLGRGRPHAHLICRSQQSASGASTACTVTEKFHSSTKETDGCVRDGMARDVTGGGGGGGCATDPFPLLVVLRGDQRLDMHKVVQSPLTRRRSAAEHAVLGAWQTGMMQRVRCGLWRGLHGVVGPAGGAEGVGRGGKAHHFVPPVLRLRVQMPFVHGGALLRGVGLLRKTARGLLPYLP
jgi:hypothetical protein